MFHFDLLDQTPVARQQALELVGGGLLVVDADGAIVDANRVARQVLNADTGTGLQSRLATGPASDAVDGATLTALVGGSRHVYDCHVAELRDDYGAFSGYAVTLQDVTERNTYEQHLEVSNRVLRHNLRNGMNVIQGYASTLEEGVRTDERARFAATIREQATDLVTLSEKLRQASVLQQRSAADAVADVTDVIEALLSEFRDAHPSVSFEFDGAEGVRVSGFSEQGLSLAVRNLLENAVEHNTQEGLEVRVAVRVDDDRVRIQIHDNGSGLPPVEREVLESRTETPLRHSSGVGLWLTRWIVNAAGGEVTVDGTDTRGTTITLVLPRKSDVKS